LEPSDLASRAGLERAFIERQGLVAWMEGRLDIPATSAVSGDPQPPGSSQAEAPRRDLILVLVDLVRGDRQEEHDD